MAGIATEEAARLTRRSELHRLLQPTSFVWLTGIEDTFVVDPHAKTGRAMDEYELTEHYGRWREDLKLMASLGVTGARYGIPWFQIQPEPNRWDFSFPDKVFDEMLRLGIDPIVDLVHYGTPPWLEGSFANPAYAERVAEYGARIAERYKGRIYWYTPLNEPRITAWYCGRIGWWPPYLRGWSGFLRVMVATAKGIAMTHRALARVDPEIVNAHVDATDVYKPMDEASRPAAELYQQLVFLALDLVTGRGDERHPLRAWMLKNGIQESELDWFLANRVEPDIIGLNLYPMFTYKEVSQTPRGRIMKKRYRHGELLEDLGRMYWERYRTPMFVSETASAGSVRRRLEWMESSIEACRSLRSEGIPMVGYTWWPMFALVAWGWRERDRDMRHYMIRMGLWDLDERGNRIETPVVDSYRDAATSGITLVGELRKGA